MVEERETFAFQETETFERFQTSHSEFTGFAIGKADCKLTREVPQRAKSSHY
jgi:hypothetical protein